MNADELLEIKCPDCEKRDLGFGIIGDLQWIARFFQRSPACELCGGAKKVLVKRGDLMKFQTR